MSTGNGPTELADATGLNILVIAASWHTQVMDNLIEGALQTIAQSGGTASLVRVPGTFELSVAAAHAAHMASGSESGAGSGAASGSGSRVEADSATGSVMENSRKIDAIVALGVVIRGGTPHFEFVCQGVTAGLTQISTEYRIPVGFGVLTCNDDVEAIERSSLQPGGENKGREAAQAAIATVHSLREITRSFVAVG